MSYEYGGVVFDSARAATLASVYDWITAGGLNRLEWAYAELSPENDRANEAEIDASGWTLPYMDKAGLTIPEAFALVRERIAEEIEAQA